MNRRLALGLDYGTESARALLVDVETGEELATDVLPYPHGVIDDRLPDSGVKLEPEWALQDPEDYLLALRTLIPNVLRQAGASPEEVEFWQRLNDQNPELEAHMASAASAAGRIPGPPPSGSSSGEPPDS